MIQSNEMILSIGLSTGIAYCSHTGWSGQVHRNSQNCLRDSRTSAGFFICIKNKRNHFVTWKIPLNLTSSNPVSVIISVWSTMDANVNQVQNVYFAGKNAFPVRLDILSTKPLHLQLSRCYHFSLWVNHNGSIHQHNKISSNTFLLLTSKKPRPNN